MICISSIIDWYRSPPPCWSCIYQHFSYSQRRPHWASALVFMATPAGQALALWQHHPENTTTQLASKPTGHQQTLHFCSAFVYSVYCWSSRDCWLQLLVGFSLVFFSFGRTTLYNIKINCTSDTWLRCRSLGQEWGSEWSWMWERRAYATIWAATHD